MLIDLPIIREQLVDLLVDVEAATALGFECNSDRYPPGHGVPRMLIPAAKSHLCRLGVSAAAQALELHGGNGCSNDFVLARLLRDAQANPIGEGTEQAIWPKAVGAGSLETTAIHLMKTDYLTGYLPYPIPLHSWLATAHPPQV